MSKPDRNQPVAVVTGASSGIGLSTVKSLLARGFFVVATMRNVTKAPAELANDPNTALRPLDVTSNESVATLAQWLRVDQNVVRCDVVVNNAGFGVPGTVETVALEAAMRVFDVNVWGVVRVTKALIPVMRERGHGGLIVVVSSTSGIRALPCSDYYAGSKFAVEGLMEALRYSVAPDNIKITIVNPGPVATSFIDRFQQEGSDAKGQHNEASLPSRMSEVFSKRLEQRISEGQTKESCAEVIADVIEREYRKDVSDGRTGVQFWNGTTASAQETIAAVKCDVTGYEGPIYSEVWKTAFNLAETARQDTAAPRKD